MIVEYKRKASRQELIERIEELKKINTPMSWEMKDKDGNVVMCLKKPDNYISKDKIRERIKHNEEQKNNVVRVAKFEINNNGITAEGIEGLNDLIVYKTYEAVINELNYLLEGN